MISGRNLISFIFCLFTAFAAIATDDLLINADNQDLDYKNNTLHFVGNVVVSQGNLSIKADELFVVTENGNGEKLIAKGQPALFIQKNEAGDDLAAQAMEIVYLVEAQILQLNGQAKFQQGGSIVESGTIEFDLQAQRVKADGDQSTGGRVTTTLKTKKTSSPD